MCAARVTLNGVEVTVEVGVVLGVAVGVGGVGGLDFPLLGYELDLRVPDTVMGTPGVLVVEKDVIPDLFNLILRIGFGLTQ